MTDIKRRNFIKNVGFVGATTLICSSSLLSQNTFTSFSNSDKDENILSKFIKSTYSDAFLFEPALLDCYKKAIINWEKTGYQSSGNFCYGSDDGQLKMFPIHLHAAGREKLDNVLLCFGKNSNGEWKPLKSLSGFDLEAISTAMKELQINNSNVDLSNYLFPAPAQQLIPYGFTTKKGNVYLKTILAAEQTSTQIIVKEGLKIVYQKEIISKHSLVANSVLV